MARSAGFENRDKFIQLGIAISTLRKLRGMSQSDLAKSVGVTRNTINTIESPARVRSFSFETFLKIAYALKIEPYELICASVLSDKFFDKS